LRVDEEATTLLVSTIAAERTHLYEEHRGKKDRGRTDHAIEINGVNGDCRDMGEVANRE
jgi:hypothetical protein